MICSHCGNFFQVTEDAVGQTVICPTCHSPVTVSRDPVICSCPECQQQCELESWTEGETFVCPGCSKAVKFAGEHRIPPKPAPTVPRFKTPGAASSGTPAPVQEQKPAFKQGNMPSFKKDTQKQDSMPAFEQNTPETDISQKKLEDEHTASANIPFESAIMQDPVRPADRNMLEESEEYAGILGKKVEEKKDKESRIHCFFRQHLRQIIRFSLYTFVVLAVCLTPVCLFSFLEKHTFGLDSSDIAKAKEMAASGKNEKLSSYLKKFSARNRFILEEMLLQEAVSKRDKKKLAGLLNFADPNGHACLMSALRPDGQFVIDAIAKSPTGFNFRFSDGSTLLERAISLPEDKIFTALLKAGANPNQPCKDGLAPVFHTFDKKKLFQTLLRYKANIYVTDWTNNSLLFAVLEQKKYDLLPSILIRQRNFTRLNKDGKTYLQLLFSEPDIPKRAMQQEYVMYFPCAINAADPSGKTALQLGIENNTFPAGQSGTSMFERMLYAGATPYPSIEEDIRNTRFEMVYSAYKSFKQKEKTDSSPKKQQGTLRKRFLASSNTDTEQEENTPEPEQDSGLFNADIGLSLLSAKVIQEARAKFASRFFEEQTSQKSASYLSPWVAGANHATIRWLYPLLFLLYAASGLLALRLARKDESHKDNEWRNILLLFGGYFTLILPILGKCCSGTVTWIRNSIDWLANKSVRHESIQLFYSNGQELDKLETAELIPVYLQLQKLFDYSFHQNITEFILTPHEKNYQIIAKEGAKERAVTETDFQSGTMVLKLLKGLAGLNVSDTVKPQNGIITVKLAERKKEVLISTVGLGNSGERGIIAIADKSRTSWSFEQTLQAPSDKKKFQTFLEGNGLFLIAGPAGSGKRAMISSQLEKIAVKDGIAAWVGNGSEPEGSDHVPRLKTDPAAGVTAARLLEAISDYPVVAVTLGTEHSVLPVLFSLAQKKKVFLLIDKPMNEAVSICRQAGTAEFESCLKLAVRPWPVQRLCSCARQNSVPPVLMPFFQMIGLQPAAIPVMTGCPKCLSRGYTENIILCETCGPHGIPPRSEPTVAWLAALHLAAAGIIGREDLEKIMKGE